jgi:hypothetical protein
VKVKLRIKKDRDWAEPTVVAGRRSQHRSQSRTIQESSIESAAPLQHSAEFTQYFDVISVAIDWNPEHSSRLHALPVIVLEPGMMEQDPGIPWIPHISRKEDVSVPDLLSESWITRSHT